MYFADEIKFFQVAIEVLIQVLMLDEKSLVLWLVPYLGRFTQEVFRQFAGLFELRKLFQL